MKAQRQIITVLVAAVLAAPVGAATWYGFGSYEPDTSYDVEGGYMQSDADVSESGKELYFNVYQSEYPTGQNLNNGVLETRIQVAGVQQYIAMFGAWKDCNGDEYVGLAESALIVYPAVLADAGICPPGSFHNDGQWVHEYVPVGFQPEPVADLHPMQIVDEDARVWGDFGLPGATSAATCPIVPLPTARPPAPAGRSATRTASPASASRRPSTRSTRTAASASASTTPTTPRRAAAPSTSSSPNRSSATPRTARRAPSSSTATRTTRTTTRATPRARSPSTPTRRGTAAAASSRSRTRPASRPARSASTTPPTTVRRARSSETTARPTRTSRTRTATTPGSPARTRPCTTRATRGPTA